VWYERAYRALKQRLGDGDLIMREYSHIVNLDMFISHSCEAAQQEDTSSLNRYCNVLPYDHNRSVVCWAGWVSGLGLTFGDADGVVMQ
jgi:hypothetical protein